jgi:hypothetical protein
VVTLVATFATVVDNLQLCVEVVVLNNTLCCEHSSNMALVWSFVSVSCSILVTPFLMFLLAIIFLASIGKSLGVRRLYVNILLKIFEVSTNNYRSLPLSFWTLSIVRISTHHRQNPLECNYRSDDH